MLLVAETVEGLTLLRCGRLCAEEQPEAFSAVVLDFTTRIPD